MTPFCVVATAGTTVAGAFDPLVDVADLCAMYGVWMHVDCCWGGAALLSRRYHCLLDGIERADSVAWNPHKMMSTTQQCAAFLTCHIGLLERAHSSCAEYLFQRDKFYDVSYDTGDKSVQCARKADAFKVWLMWKQRGAAGFEAVVDGAVHLAQYLTSQLSRRDGFRLVYAEPEFTNVCFWYVPPSLRGQVETPDWWKKLGNVSLTVCLFRIIIIYPLDS